MTVGRAQHPAVKHIRNDVTTTAGTLSSAPASVNVDLGLVVVDAVEILIPPGHAGTTGIQILYDGVAIIPWSQAGSWLVGEDVDRSFTLGLPVAHPVTVRTFNVDTVYDHTHYLNFVCRDQLTGGGFVVPAEPELVPLDLLNA